MAIFGLGNNKADDWQNWTISVAKNPSEKQDDFRINPKGNTDIEVFNKKLEEISDEYIKQYDTNGDNKISYEEFEVYELKQLKENQSDIDGSLLEKAKTNLKNLYNNLNVDNDNESENQLDKREIMNMFHTMDGSNDAILNPDERQMHIDGLISQDEYTNLTEALSEEPLSAQEASKMIDAIDKTVDEKNLPEGKKFLIKNEMLNSIIKTFSIQNFLKANYEANFKNIK